MHFISLIAFVTAVSALPAQVSYHTRDDESTDNKDIYNWIKRDDESTNNKDIYNWIKRDDNNKDIYNWIKRDGESTDNKDIYNWIKRDGESTDNKDIYNWIKRDDNNKDIYNWIKRDGESTDKRSGTYGEHLGEVPCLVEQESLKKHLLTDYPCRTQPLIQQPHWTVHTFRRRGFRNLNEEIALFLMSCLEFVF